VKKNNINFQSTLDTRIFRSNFGLCFEPGAIVDRDIERRIVNLSQMFKVYMARCHVPVWSKGLVVTDEIVRITENYLDYSTIQRSLLRLVEKSMRIQSLPPPLLLSVDRWIPLLELMPVLNDFVNPALLLKYLAEDENYRMQFLFAAYLPQQFGGSFNRYPEQMEFLRRWVAAGSLSSTISVNCLDAACGSGEGSYELARMLLESGVDQSRIRITGVTLTPVEVFAAAHAYFPHDVQRKLRYRKFLESMVRGGGNMPHIKFMTGDLNYLELSEKYEIIICNGVLGGPMLHDSKEVENVIRRLSGSLSAGGVLVAADRFHGGWKKKMSNRDMETIIRKCGLDVITVPKGIAGLRSN
jgi:chemotaxis methyl-accepting protein methylase